MLLLLLINIVVNYTLFDYDTTPTCSKVTFVGPGDWPVRCWFPGIYPTHPPHLLHDDPIIDPWWSGPSFPIVIPDPRAWWCVVVVWCLLLTTPRYAFPDDLFWRYPLFGVLLSPHDYDAWRHLTSDVDDVTPNSVDDWLTLLLEAHSTWHSVLLHCYWVFPYYDSTVMPLTSSRYVMMPIVTVLCTRLCYSRYHCCDAYFSLPGIVILPVLIDPWLLFFIIHCIVVTILIRCCWWWLLLMLTRWHCYIRADFTIFTRHTTFVTRCWVLIVGDGIQSLTCSRPHSPVIDPIRQAPPHDSPVPDVTIYYCCRDDYWLICWIYTGYYLHGWFSVLPDSSFPAVPDDSDFTRSCPTRVPTRTSFTLPDLQLIYPTRTCTLPHTHLPATSFTTIATQICWFVCSCFPVWMPVTLHYIRHTTPCCWARLLRVYYVPHLLRTAPHDFTGITVAHTGLLLPHTLRTGYDFTVITRTVLHTSPHTAFRLLFPVLTVIASIVMMVVIYSRYWLVVFVVTLIHCWSFPYIVIVVIGDYSIPLLLCWCWR